MTCIEVLHHIKSFVLEYRYDRYPSKRTMSASFASYMFFTSTKNTQTDPVCSIMCCKNRVSNWHYL